MAEISAQTGKRPTRQDWRGHDGLQMGTGRVQGRHGSRVDWLRAKGCRRPRSKAGRVAAEGLVGVALRGKVGAVVEVNSETDFVARNAVFQAAGEGDRASLALKAGGDVAKARRCDLRRRRRPVADHLKGDGWQASARTCRCAVLLFWRCQGRRCASYVHNAMPRPAWARSAFWSRWNRRATRKS